MLLCKLRKLYKSQIRASLGYVPPQMHGTDGRAAESCNLNVVENRDVAFNSLAPSCLCALLDCKFTVSSRTSIADSRTQNLQHKWNNYNLIQEVWLFSDSIGQQSELEDLTESNPSAATTRL